MLSRQEIFDKVVAHMREQGRPAMNDDGCRYRTADGAKCAVGCLIPDDRYHRRLEGNGIMNSFGKPRVALARALDGIVDFNENARFLWDIQIAHDTSAGKSIHTNNFFGEFLSRMRTVATTYRLDPGEATR